MTPTTKKFGRRLFYTTSKTAAVFEVSESTTLRWARWIVAGSCPDALSGLEVFRDPVNGFYYFSAASVKQVKQRIIAARRICLNRCKHA